MRRAERPLPRASPGPRRSAEVRQIVRLARGDSHLRYARPVQGSVQAILEIESQRKDPVCGELLNLAENTSATQSCESFFYR